MIKYIQRRNGNVKKDSNTTNVTTCKSILAITYINIYIQMYIIYHKIYTKKIAEI